VIIFITHVIATAVIIVTIAATIVIMNKARDPNQQLMQWKRCVDEGDTRA